MPAPSRARAELPPPRGSCATTASDQRRRLLEALPLAVAEKGFEATSVEQIVKIAKVRRNAFYAQFDDKEACFAAAYEKAQERLLGALTYRCYTRAGLTDRVGAAVGAGLDLLAANPALARLIFVEASAAGDTIAARHHQWLDRYGRMLRFAAMGSPVKPPKPSIEPAIVGGIVSRVKQLVLAGETERLPQRRPELVQFTLSFFGSLGPSTASGGSDSAESLQPQSPDRSAVLEPV